MSRSTPEWIGRNDDSAIPPRVKVRVFERHNGICHLSGRPIRAGERWDCDHVIALCNGGQHRESNLAPALAAPHKIKTAADVAEKATVYRKRLAHLGLKPKGRPMPGSKASRFKRCMDGTVELRK